MDWSKLDYETVLKSTLVSLQLFFKRLKAKEYIYISYK